MRSIIRFCTEEARENRQNSTPQPISAYENSSAYVLLGNPGAGKTTVFNQEAERPDTCFVTARDLITFDIDHHPDWRDKTLFIDGLDEIRAGATDVRTPLDRIRAKLDQLGRPRFRLSCREADWFGASDRDNLKAVSPDRQITVLHLDPLSDDNVIDILSEGRDETDASTFISEARKKGLEELLKNPQTLDMLAKAVTDENWPDSRTKTFEIACWKMLIEYNKEHGIAAGATSVNENRLLDAAGFLCAAQLIAGKSGFALTRETKDTNFPCIEDLDYGDIPSLKQVAQRNLFKASGTGRIEPTHRHIAEHLAAGFLANRIASGLPIGRVLSLITGEDGVVVSELRGLSAWLAALCISERRVLIDRDPLGVVLYGDVKAFAEQDKIRLLDGLHRETKKNPWFHSSNWTSSPFGALATPDMEGEFEKILMAPDRDESDQALAHCVLVAMVYGDRLPSLDDVLISIIRDETWWPHIREAALEVIDRRIATDPGLASRMKSILEEISRGEISDPDDGLAGILLEALYPGTVNSEEVFDHLHAPTNLNYSGMYRNFWKHTLLKKSSDEDVRRLLDQLASRTDAWHSATDDEYLTTDGHPFRYTLTSGGLLAGRLLVKGLEVHGESIDTVRLYRWLGIGLDRYGHRNRVREDQIRSIRGWLSSRPEVQKSIICAGEQVCREGENSRACLYHMRQRRYQAKPPDDFGLWCLQRMPSLSDDELARNMLREAVNSIRDQRGNEGLSLELIEETVAGNEKHKIWLTELLVCSVEDEDWELQQIHWRQDADEQKKRKEWIRCVRHQESVLREGTAPPHLLHDLSGVYFAHFTDLEGDTPVERLRHFLGQDEGLVESVLEGFRRSIDRNDVPAVREIIRLDVQNQTHFLSRPVLAGLAENSRYSPEYILQLSDSQIEKAIVCYLTAVPVDDAPWYELLLESRPELVSQVLIEYVTAVFRRKKQHVAGLRMVLDSLVYADEYFPVAEMSTLAMLKVFPARCTNQQLELLDPLLKSALRHVDREALLTRIETKLSFRSMNSAQRVYWLATGLIVDPEQYQEKFADFIQGDENCTRHLARFLWYRHEQWSLLDDLPVSTIGLLVRVVGRYFAPYSRKAGAVSMAMQTADFVLKLINQLGSNAAQEATDTLDSLLGNVDLVKWHSKLQRVQFEQLAIRREAGFRHPGIGQVVSTLSNKAPANAGDLAAMVLDTLQNMAHRIRNSNTDDYKQYWNLKTGSVRPATPRHEDACRDALLSDLKTCLALLGVDAQPEGQYADDKRSDIRVSVGGGNDFAVPIEIKKNNHPDLWRAIHDQLIARYTLDPLTDGFGIYLVFWFGADRTQPPPSGKRPRSTDELEQRLRATLSTDENRKISICVVDVANPAEAL